VLTEIAFVSDAAGRVAIAGAIGAGRDAVAAADTFDRINGDNTVGLLVGGIHGAGRHTGWFVALHALAGLVLGSAAANSAGMSDPVAPETFGDLVFNLTGNHAGLTVKAFKGVDHNRISFDSVLTHQWIPSISSS
jgi:hypothetical protein